MLAKKNILILLLAAGLLLPGLAGASSWGVCTYLDPGSRLYRLHCMPQIPGTTQHTSPAAPVKRSVDTVTHMVVMPPALTVVQQQERQTTVTEDDTGTAVFDRPRLIGGYLRYESARADDYDDASIYGGTVGFAFDTTRFSFGVIIPYDYMNYDTVKAHRVGAVGFGAFTQGVTQRLDLIFGANISYMHLNPFDEPEGQTFDSINYYGGGLSTTLVYDAGILVPSIAVMYQYTKDDSDSEYDYSHLLRVGGQLGVRMGARMVLNPFVIWTRDISSYATSDDIYNYFDAGLELGVSLTETFTFSAGYKKVLGISGVDNDMGYLGLLYRF